MKPTREAEPLRLSDTIGRALTRSLLAASLSIAAATLFLGAACAVAQPPPEPGHHRRRPPFEQILELHADRLNLDDATLEKIRAIAVEARKEARPLHERLRESREAMRRLLDQEPPDEGAVMEQAERIGTLEIEVQKQRLRTMLKIRALLTPAQRRELVKIHEERRRHRRGSQRKATPPAADEATPAPSE